MNEENVYLKPSPVDSIHIKDGDENIKVKDNMQIVKLQGLKGTQDRKVLQGLLVLAVRVVLVVVWIYLNTHSKQS